MKTLVWVAAVVLGVVAGWLISFQSDSSGQYTSKQHNLSMYDSTSETFCVRSEANESINLTNARNEIAGFLNDTSGWEQVGTGKIDFSPLTSCGSERLEFIFEDSGEGCLGFNSGVYHGDFNSSSFSHWHEHWDLNQRICLEAEGWHGWWDTDDKRGVINHEVGHAIGHGHGGPAWGKTNGGTIWDFRFGQRPSDHEWLAARDHLDDLSPRAMYPCVGFTTSTKLIASWFDQAEDDNSNRARFFRQPTGGGAWTDTFSILNGNVAGWGNRATFISGDRADINANWKLRSEVIGPFGSPTLSESPSVSFPGTGGNPPSPCTVMAQPGTNAREVSTTWVDASHNESAFEIWYAEADDEWGSATNGFIGIWQFRGTCPANGQICVDTADTSGCIGVAVCIDSSERLCVKLRAKTSGGAVSPFGNVTCTGLIGVP